MDLSAMALARFCERYEIRTSNCQQRSSMAVPPLLRGWYESRKRSRSGRRHWPAPPGVLFRRALRLGSTARPMREPRTSSPRPPSAPRLSLSKSTS
jgi:hypothetical protein